MVDAALLSRVKMMSPADRLELLGAVWDTLSPADAPVTEEGKALLDVRLADLENNPQDQSPWSEVKTRLQPIQGEHSGVSMDITLKLVNANGSPVTSLGAVEFAHGGCGPMIKHRNPATNEYSLHCGCSLDVNFPDMGDAHREILAATSDGLTRNLPVDSFTSNRADSIRLLPIDIAESS